jgi:hypothetical protein
MRIELTPENAAALAKYAASVAHTPIEFLNRFLDHLRLGRQTKAVSSQFVVKLLLFLIRSFGLLPLKKKAQSVHCRFGNVVDEKHSVRRWRLRTKSAAQQFGTHTANSLTVAELDKAEKALRLLQLYDFRQARHRVGNHFFCASFAQESLKGIVRFNIKRPGLLSSSTAK